MAAFVQCTKLSPVPAHQIIGVHGRRLVATLFLALAAWFAFRRAIGAFSRPLSLAEIIAFGVILVMVSGLMSIETSKQFWTQVAVVCIGVVVSLPNTSWSGLGCLWGFVLVAVLIPLFSSRQDLAFARPQTSRRADVETRSMANDRMPAFVPPAFDSGSVSQKLIREWVTADTECVRGILRVRCDAGHRENVAHTSFCPPFSHSPQVKFVQSDGPAATVRLLQVLPYGLEFDVRLRDAPVALQTVELKFTATSSRKLSDVDGESDW